MQLTKALFGIIVLAGIIESKLFDYRGARNSHDEPPEELNQYSISDIVERHRALTQVTRDEAEVFKNPKYDTSCIKKALGPILPKCLRSSIDNIDPELRARTAAKLSICEFEVAKITYPTECYPKRYFFGNDEDSICYEDCIQSLEKSPQWWTTYSGNYRAIGDICFQESLPYEKDEILNLFLNVTEIYDKILEDLTENIEISSSFKESSRKSFEDLKKFMDDVLIKTQEDSNKERKAYAGTLKEMNKVLEETNILTKILSNNTMDVTDVLISQLQTLGEGWEGFFDQYNGDEFMKELISMRDVFVEDIAQKNSDMNELLDSYFNRLMELKSISERNTRASFELQGNLEKSLEKALEMSGVLEKTGDSMLASSQLSSNLLSTFKELDQMNIGELLNVSEQELLLVFQRITDQLNKEMMSVQSNARTLEYELAELVDRIDEATGSLIKINNILRNNIFVRLLLFFSAKLNSLGNKAIILTLSFMAYYYLLVVKFQLLGKRPKLLVVLFFSCLGGFLLGTALIKGFTRFSGTKISELLAI